MKKLIFSMLTLFSLSMMSCNSEKKNDDNADSLADTSMSASPGLDTSGTSTDTTTIDTATTDTTISQPQ